MAGDKLVLLAQRMMTPLEEYGPAAVVVEGGRIAAVGRIQDVELPADATVIDVGEKILIPGFVDIHIHGAMGARAGVSVEDTLKVAAYLPATGTTSWLPTVNSAERVRNVVRAKEVQTQGADIAGIHLEGPYLAPKNLPGSAPEDKPVPTVAELRSLWAAAQGHLRLMGIALELENALPVIAEMRRLGVVPAVAHSKATYEEFQRAVAAGLRHVTHTYNVMSGLHHRKPGIVGGALTNDQVTAELIADGFHVHPAAMDILMRCKGPDKVCLITDHTQWAGLPDGDYGTVVKSGGTVRTKGFGENVDHTLAGSVWPLNHNVHNAAQVLCGNLRLAVRMATLNPARAVGLDERKGSIEPGKDADFAVIDENAHVYLTIVGGRVQYQTGS